MSDSQTISVSQLAEFSSQDKIQVIDVRTPLEYLEVHAPMARNVPLDALDPHEVMKDRDGSSCKEIYVICKSGARGAKAQQKFINAGFTNVINVDGGTEAWVKAGLPAIRGKKAMSLERQVRIAAGSIVFLGAAAAMVTGNVYFAGIPVFVGAGLIFAGITDNCAMGMLIAKMPWNHCQAGSSSV